MKLLELNPYVRFAAEMLYDASYSGSFVRVNDCRLFFILDGGASLAIGEREYSLFPGCLFYCRAGSIYSVRMEQPTHLISLNFDLSMGHGHRGLPFSPNRNAGQWEDMQVLLDRVEDSSFLNDHLYLENAGELLTLAKQTVTDFAAGGRYSAPLCCAGVKTLLTRLHLFAPGQLPPKVAQVRDHIDAHFAQPLTNRTLAELVGYHEYYLNRIFTAATGQSLHSYLLTVRLNRAVYLMLNTDRELQAISEEVGFVSYPHFSSRFKKIYSCSPAQYRKQLRCGI